MPVDEYGIQRSSVTGLTPEGRDVPAGTTAAEYRAMLAAESARNIAAVERSNDPRISPLAQALMLGGGRTNIADGARRVRETWRVL